MVLKENVFITPFQTSRTLHIYLPDNLKEGQRCKVVYMFDGHNLFFDQDATFGTCWGLKTFLDTANRTQEHPIMIVGLECNHESNHRLWEFSPYDFCDRTWGEVHGLGGVLTEWMVRELKPYIDSKYPTLPQAQHTAIAGSSMGGLMAIYVGTVASQTFGRAACLSPYLPFVYRRLCREVQRAGVTGSTFYISWGAHECSTHRRLAKYSEQNLNIARLLTQKGNVVYPHIYENQDHSEGSWAHESGAWMSELGLLE